MTYLAIPLPLAAQRLGMSRDFLQRWLRRNPCDRHGLPFYRIAGKRKSTKAGVSDDAGTPFTREGSQVQSLSRPP